MGVKFFALCRYTIKASSRGHPVKNSSKQIRLLLHLQQAGGLKKITKKRRTT